MALLAGHRTCDSHDAGSSPSWSPSNHGYLQLCASVTKQYNLVQANGVISLAGKVTVGLMKSNGSLPLSL